MALAAAVAATLGAGHLRADGPVTAPAIAPATQPSQTPSESGVNDANTVTITANRLATPTTDVGSSSSIITAEEIAQKQQPFVSDVLRGTPGLDLVRSGGPSQQTSIFTRGANSEDTLVLIDGIVANDPSSPSRAFDFSTLLVNDIDRIEVLRGPQSTLWGSNAMGGVVNIITRRGEGPLSGYALAEGGSFNTFRESVGFSGGDKHVNYSLNVTQADSQGFPAADARFGNHTPDGYNNQALAGRIGYVFSPEFDIDLIARYQHNRVRIDDGGGPGQDDPNRFLKSDQEYLRLQPHLVLFDGALVQTYGFNYTHYFRNDTDPAAPTNNDGSLLQFDFQNDVRISKDNTLTAGLVLTQEDFSSTGMDWRYASGYGIFLQDQMNFNNSLYFTGGARYEDHTIGRSSLTYRFTAAYLLPTATKFHTSYGTGFKSPTLSDLYSSYGSPTLKPEKSMGFDFGVEQGLFDRALVLDATYFNSHFTDLIDYDFASNHEENIGAARTQGAELGASIHPCRNVIAGINYTYTQSEDETMRTELLRRPKNKVGAFVNWKYVPKGNVSLSVNYVSSRADIDPVTFNNSRVGAYVLVNVSTSYQLSDHVELYARIDNLLNQHYEEVDGYGVADISAYAGVKVKF